MSLNINCQEPGSVCPGHIVVVVVPGKKSCSSLEYLTMKITLLMSMVAVIIKGLSTA